MLLDTSGLLCCFDANDYRHNEAIQHYDSARVRVSHNYVIAEFVALAHARRLPRKESLNFAAALAGDPKVEVVWIDPLIHQEALVLLQLQLDKTYSLCDAVSLVLMRRHSISDALSTDQHFEQAGLRRLLPS